MTKESLNFLIAGGLLSMAVTGLWLSAYKVVNTLSVVSIILGATAGNSIRAAHELKDRK